MHLGTSEQERYHKQCISFDVSISFEKPLAASSTDNIDDAFCYEYAANLIENHVQNKRYNLIEYLAADIHKILLNKSHDNVFLSVKVTKFNLPIPSIHGGVSFTYSE